jgi:hypothetical protein
VFYISPTCEGLFASMKWNEIFHTGKYEFRRFRGSQWHKILYHNMTEREYGFSDESEAIQCDSVNKYSILSELNSSYKINEKFEFLLEFPESDEYYQWRQTNNPLDEVENGNNAQGFQSIHTAQDYVHWGGLLRSSENASEHCLLNGTPKVLGTLNIFFAVGMYNTMLICNEIPQYNIAGNRKPVNIEYLWVRTPIFIHNTCRTKRYFSRLISFSLLLVC